MAAVAMPVVILRVPDRFRKLDMTGQNTGDDRFLCKDFRRVSVRKRKIRDG